MCLHSYSLCVSITVLFHSFVVIYQLIGRVNICVPYEWCDTIIYKTLGNDYKLWHMHEFFFIKLYSSMYTDSGYICWLYKSNQLKYLF